MSPDPDALTFLPSQLGICYDISESYELYPAYLLLLIYQIASSERFGIILRGCVTLQSLSTKTLLMCLVIGTSSARHCLCRILPH